MAVVELERLTKLYPGSARPAAEDMSLTIADGEFMVLLGPSGCGKTTTLRMIAGLETISSGTLSIDGTRVNAVPAKDRDIAMVFQSYALYPHMTVKDNMAFGLKRRSVSASEIERRVASVAKILGLDGLLDRKPHALSGGQRQRVALGRAIVRDPKVFLFDEPLSNLDAALRVSTRGEISALHRRLGATMIYVTHDQVEAMTLGTRICIMNGGRIAQVGTPLDVYNNPADTFVAGFLGSPPMNLMAAVSAGDRCVRAGGSVIEVPADRMQPSRSGTALTLGVRPEDMELGEASASGGPGFVGEIVQVERLGAETIVIVQCHDVGRLVTRRPGDARLSVGEMVRLVAPVGAYRVFDQSGLSLQPKRS